MNQVFLTGRLTKDVEAKQTQSGTAYARFSLAVDKYKNKEKSTIFVDCVAFGHSANFLAKYCSKGSLVFVQGELDCNTKERDDGSKVTYWNVIVNNVEANKPQQTQTEEGSLPFEL